MAAPTPPLFTIGYEKSTPDAVVAALTRAGVKTLIDVRAVPASRRPGFSKNKLAERLNQAHIAYVHLRDLGTPKAGREAARAGDTPTMHRIFAVHMKKPEALAALAIAIGIARESKTCLLCLERTHADCHRAIVADMMTEAAGFKVEALVPTTV